MKQKEKVPELQNWKHRPRDEEGKDGAISKSLLSLAGDCDDPCLALFISGLSQQPSGPPHLVFTSGSRVDIFASLYLQGREGPAGKFQQSGPHCLGVDLGIFSPDQKVEETTVGVGRALPDLSLFLWPRPR